MDVNQHTGISGNVFKMKYKSGDTFHFAFLSDLHLLNSSTNEKTIIKCLNKAKSMDARINFNGDIADLILTKDIKRNRPSVLIDEIQGRDDILNQSVDYVVNFLLPYVHNIDEIADGNHEAAILAHHNYNFNKEVVRRLNVEAGTNIKQGLYIGHIVYRFKYGGNSAVSSFIIRRQHGQTTASPVTKSIIEFNRILELSEGMDIVWLAHSHDITGHPVEREYVDKNGQTQRRHVWCVRTGAYAMHTQGAYQSVHGMTSKPHGFAMAHLTLDRRGKKYISVEQHGAIYQKGT